MGDDFTIADVSMLGWVSNLVGFYDAGDLVGFDELKRVAGLARSRPRPARGQAGAGDTEARVR